MCNDEKYHEIKDASRLKNVIVLKETSPKVNFGIQSKDAIHYYAI